jgi:hypothetical protein
MRFIVSPFKYRANPKLADVPVIFSAVLAPPPAIVERMLVVDIFLSKEFSTKYKFPVESPQIFQAIVKLAEVNGVPSGLVDINPFPA